MTLLDVVWLYSIARLSQWGGGGNKITYSIKMISNCRRVVRAIALKKIVNPFLRLETNSIALFSAGPYSRSTSRVSSMDTDWRHFSPAGQHQRHGMDHNRVPARLDCCDLYEAVWLSTCSVAVRV